MAFFSCQFQSRLRCLQSNLSQIRFYLALMFRQRKGRGWRVWEHGERWRDRAGRVKEKAQEQNEWEGRRNPEDIYRRTGREEKSGKTEGWIRDGEKKTEVALVAELFQRAGMDNLSCLSVELHPRLESRERCLINYINKCPAWFLKREPKFSCARISKFALTGGRRWSRCMTWMKRMDISPLGHSPHLHVRLPSPVVQWIKSPTSV